MAKKAGTKAARLEKDKPLKGKQGVFVEEYLTCWNATEAARRAGYSERSIRSIASENLTKPNVKAAIEARLSELAMQANEVLFRLTEQARGIGGSYFVVGRSALDKTIEIDFQKLVADGMGHLIKSLSYSKDGTLTKVEFYDAQAALVHIGRHYAMFTDKIADDRPLAASMIGLMGLGDLADMDDEELNDRITQLQRIQRRLAEAEHGPGPASGGASSAPGAAASPDDPGSEGEAHADG